MTTSTKDAYDVLMETLGFPGSARLRAILETLMTPGQATLVGALPGSISEVAEKTSVPEDDVRKSFDDLYRKGAVFPKDFSNRDYYRFARSIVQLHDAQASQALDPERDRAYFLKWHDFCNEEMYPRLATMLKDIPSPPTRIVPAYNAIKDLPGVLPNENFHELLKAQDMIAVVPCSCRFRTTSVGEQCEHTAEVETWHCLQFGRGAEYVISRGSGKKLSTDEALALCDAIEEDGLLHQWTNNANMTGVNTSCQCCRDCCEFYVSFDRASIPIGAFWQKSRYEAYVADLDSCTGCQDCVDRCQFDAIEMVKAAGSKRLKAAIDPEKCFGCGACVVGCPAESLAMRVVRPPEFIPGAVA
jgi:H+/Na+-translocating ferredoxin:NAD+ oxidoreductase subunit B